MANAPTTPANAPTPPAVAPKPPTEKQIATAKALGVPVEKYIETLKQQRGARETIDPNETPAQRFSRLASARMRKALLAITAIEPLGGSGYEYTAEQATRIIAALSDAVVKVERKLNKVKAERAEIESFTV